MRKKHRKLSILLTVAALIAIAWLTPAQAAAPGARWVSIVKNLQQKGISEVRGLDMASLLREGRKVRWHIFRGRPAGVDSGDRASAFFRPGEVYLSSDAPAAGVNALAELELHEVLGALGYADHDYAISTSLASLAHMSASEEARALVRAWEQDGGERDLRIAGGSSVVGGGDSLMLQLKQDVLTEIVAQGGSYASAEFRASFAAIGFEPFRAGKKVSLKFSARTGSAKQILTVLVPPSLASRRPTETTREIAAKIIALYSDAPNSDSDVATVREARRRAAQPLPDQTEFSVISGANLSTQEPREAGTYYFACEMSHGSSTLKRRVPILAQASVEHSIEWSVEGAYTVRGVIGVYPGGKIVTSYIFFRAQEGHAPVVARGKISAGGKAARAEMLVRGSPLLLRCDREE